MSIETPALAPVVCEVSALRQALRLVSLAVSTRTTLPILQNVLLEAEDDWLHLTATDLSVAIRTEVARKQETGPTRNWRMTLPARLLSDFVAALPGDQPVAMWQGDEGSEVLSLRCQHFQSKLYGLPPEDFPPGHDCPQSNPISVTVGDLLVALRSVRIALSTDESRPILTGVLLSVRDERLCVVATDGHRLAEQSRAQLIPVDPIPDDWRAIVPGRTVAILLRALQGANPDDYIRITRSESGNQLGFSCEPVQVTSSVIDGTYPRYESVLPVSPRTSMRIERARLIATLEGLATLAPQDRCLRLRVLPGVLSRLHLSVRTAEVAEGEAEIPIDLAGPEISAALNVTYLLEVLRVINEPKVEIGLDGALSPVLIRPTNDPGGHRHVIMPIRLVEEVA
jgi:DNA polymerase-3 subunit beta